MKTVILAGGFGTRLSEFTDVIPKPMVRIGPKPMLWHIMNGYASFGHKDFYVALGYKAEVIKEYFMNYYALGSDFTVDLKTGEIQCHNDDTLDWRVTMVDTGIGSMTGGRVRRMREHVGDETFMLTYGDGLSDINITNLLDHHEKSGKMVTVSAVRPTARFGELNLDGDSVVSFTEKPHLDQGWINGGFFVIEPEFFDYINGDDTVLEKEPLERVASEGNMNAFRHDGFWQCMDTKRDRDALNQLQASGDAPWT